MAKILLTSVGTYGDLNPIICFSKYLISKKHEVTIAAAKYYENSITRAGINYIRTSPDYNPSEPELAKKILKPYLTLYYIHKEILNYHNLENGIKDFLKITKDYDYVIGNVFSYHAKIACLINKTPWISINLSPLCFFSSKDPPSLYPLFFFKLKHHFFYNLFFKFLSKFVNHWGNEVLSAYKRYDLEKPKNLLLDTPFSDVLNIALFPKAFASPAKDWPKNTIQTNFFNYSGEDESLPRELTEFSSNGYAPILITFGSLAIHIIDELKKIFLPFIRNSHYRFVITTSNLKDEDFLSLNDEFQKIYLCEHIPYTTGMKIMSGVIHQGGIGTTACALEAEIPQIIIPTYADQFDNGFRIKNLKLGNIYISKFKTSKDFELMAEALFSQQDDFRMNFEHYKNNIETSFNAKLENYLNSIR